MNNFCLWCSEVSCWQEQIHKFKTEYLLIWQKYLSTWTSIKYFGHQVQVSTKYFWISKGQVQVSTKYSIIRIKYQVPSTSTLLDPNPGISTLTGKDMVDYILFYNYGDHKAMCTWFVWFCVMLTSSNGNIFRVTGPLCGEFTGPRWIPLIKASDADLWYFLWPAPE